MLEESDDEMKETPQQTKARAEKLKKLLGHNLMMLFQEAQKNVKVEPEEKEDEGDYGEIGIKNYYRKSKIQQNFHSNFTELNPIFIEKLRSSFSQKYETRKVIDHFKAGLRDQIENK